MIIATSRKLFQIQNRIRYFLSRPVSVNLRIQHVDQMRFPTVTVCNENRITYSAAAYHGERDPQQANKYM